MILNPPGMATDSDSDSDPLQPLARLERAINRARQAAPAQGAEAALGRDVAVLGRLYGRLIWRRESGFRLSDIEDDECEAYRRWQGDA